MMEGVEGLGGVNITATDGAKFDEIRSSDDLSGDQVHPGSLRSS